MKTILQPLETISLQFTRTNRRFLTTILLIAQTQNSTTDATGPAKKTKTESPAVVGPRLTKKNLAKADWLAKKPGVSGLDFEAHYKTLTPEEKKNFAAQAKFMQKAARSEKRAMAKNAQS
ncbi:hypothetical protein LshimejAT787_1100590 [Lyophyllum shimeji]|uniref:Uncharacterized protein n=1 Tax=Lyophyllum shimeji TaxID=47721 RepID=A0A9P3PV31_LYOSH|nr:hypothetical protein LshimejAT787_1100590 [Lyophyllum shimeji]